MLILFIAVCGAIVAFSAIRIFFDNSTQVRVRERLNVLAESTDLDSVHTLVLKEKRKRKRKNKTRLISQQFEDSLALSGVKLSAQEYISLWIAATLLPMLVLLLLGKPPLAIAAIGIVGFALPPILVHRTRAQQQILFNKQLGESLTIMGNCMRSGYSFLQAMSSIANEMQPPISTEFARVVRAITYGVPQERALDNMVRRVNNKDLELLVSAVNTSSQVGANLSDILNIISETVRDRIGLREEIRTLSAQGRMSGMIIGLLPIIIVLILMVMNPTYFTSFVANPMGQKLIALGIAMEVIGFIIINKIVNIHY